MKLDVISHQTVPQRVLNVIAFKLACVLEHTTTMVVDVSSVSLFYRCFSCHVLSSFFLNSYLILISVQVPHGKGIQFENTRSRLSKPAGSRI